jgi:hypothetical protein
MNIQYQNCKFFSQNINHKEREIKKNSILALNYDQNWWQAGKDLDVIKYVQIVCEVYHNKNRIFLLDNITIQCAE